MNQAYRGACIILPTKHTKSTAISPSFWKKLQARVIEYVVDTDTLGTFSGEVERQGNALECARRKCQLALDLLGNKVEYCIASEGCFGPHPQIQFIPYGQEILYFIDRKRGFHLHLLHLSERTNYRTQAVDSFETLKKLAEDVQFPSHALILRPNAREIRAPLFKGIVSPDTLEDAFTECIKHSKDNKVWVETDMRAHYNPTRMAVIGELANRMADRLASCCPACAAPGWGYVDIKKA